MNYVKIDPKLPNNVIKEIQGNHYYKYADRLTKVDLSAVWHKVLGNIFIKAIEKKNNEKHKRYNISGRYMRGSVREKRIETQNKENFEEDKQNGHEKKKYNYLGYYISKYWISADEGPI